MSYDRDEIGAKLDQNEISTINPDQMQALMAQMVDAASLSPDPSSTPTLESCGLEGLFTPEATATEPACTQEFKI